MRLNEPILETVRDHLSEELKNLFRRDRSVKITNEERIPQWAGEEFINLFGAETVNLYPPSFSQRKEVTTLRVGITRRFAGQPLDHTAESIYTYKDDLMARIKPSMSARASEIIDLIDGNWDLVNEVSQIAGGCILTPLGYEGNSGLTEVFADHFSIEEDEDDNPVGLFLELTFSGMEAHYSKY